MSTKEQTPLSQPTSVVRNTLGKEQVPQDVAEKVRQEKVQQENLKAVKACLNFEETSQHSELGTPSRRRDLKERWPRRVRSMSGSPEPRRGCSEIEDKGKSLSGHSSDSRRRPYHSSRRDTKSSYQSSRSRAIKSASKKHHNKRTSSRRMEAFHIKTYDGSEDPEDHLKIFQAAAKTERWAMPTWCHMFNSTLTGNARVWFDDLPQESINSYDDLKKAFLENYLQQKKCIKDLVEIHNIKQRVGESTEESMRRYKLECKDMKEAPECMKITEFMHGITNPELIK
ncbi:reverse transcriptase domain-containing protein [Tanacetum coccineum]